MSLATDAGLSWRDDMMAEEAKERRRDHQAALAERYRRDGGSIPALVAPLAEDYSTRQ